MPYLHFKGFQSCDVLLSHTVGSARHRQWRNISLPAANMPFGVQIPHPFLNVKRPRTNFLKVSFVCNDVIKMAVNSKARSANHIASMQLFISNTGYNFHNSGSLKLYCYNNTIKVQICTHKFQNGGQYGHQKSRNSCKFTKFLSNTLHVS